MKSMELVKEILQLTITLYGEELQNSENKFRDSV